MTFNRFDFGMRIQEARTQKHMTQMDLAEQIGTCFEFVSKLERGIKTCSFDVLIKLSCSLDVTTDYLLMGTRTDTLSPKESLQAIISQLTDLVSNM